MQITYTVLFVYIIYNCVFANVADRGSYRLSTDTIPTHYSIMIHPCLNEEFFKGEVSIYVRTTNILDKITLHSSGLNITEASINRIVVRFEYEENEKLSLSYSNDTIQPGEHILHITYMGVLREDEEGFIKAPYNYNGEKGYIFVSDFEPISARKAFPCFDEPAFKSKFNIRLVTPDDTYKAISNMPKVNMFSTSYGVVHDFATTVTMSTYLVSFAIAKYSCYEDVLEENGRILPIRVYTYNASRINNEFAINCTKKAIQFYSAYTNISYPLPKLDMIEYKRSLSAATENWGMITLREGLLTLTLSRYDEQQIKTVIYHELSHFWFGNLVTNNWWNDLWLHEGFATYMSYKLYCYDQDKRQPSRTFFFNAFSEVEKTLPTRPIVDYLTTQTLLQHRFDNVVYEKAASVLLMIENVIGEEIFQKVLQTFLNRYAYKTATTNDFISIIEEVATPQPNVRNFMESYLYQDRFPLIHIAADDKGKFILRQKVCPTTANFSTAGQRWTFPITYVTNVNRTPILTWFDKDMEDMFIDGSETKWILLNKGDIGIYRVQYSLELWKTLITYFQNFLRRRFNETHFPRQPYQSDENCSKIKNIIKIEEENIDLEYCAKWISKNLPAN